jgi:hypothetical protein
MTSKESVPHGHGRKMSHLSQRTNSRVRDERWLLEEAAEWVGVRRAESAA